MTAAQRQAIDELLRHAPLDLGGDVNEQRSVFEQMMSAIPLPPDVELRPGTLGGVPTVEITTTSGGDTSGVLLYFHGGAYAIGTATLAAGLASDIARRSGTRAISVEYRLAPEHPPPCRDQ